MKVKLSKENLLIGIQTVQNIVSSKATLPILSNILLETTKKESLKLNTTDLDLGISCEIPVDILEEGAITIPAKRFSDIVKEMPVGDVIISARKNNQVDIEGEKCRFKLNGLPKEEFPKFPEFKDKEAIKLEQSVFKDMLEMTSFAVSYEESRYVLNGVFLEVMGDQLRAVATDGRRLAKIERKLTHNTKKEINVIIPIKAIHEILRNLKDEGELSFSMGTNQVLFEVNDVLIATRIIEGEFPNYNQAIEKVTTANAPRIKVDTQNLLSAIRRANLLSTPDFQAVKFEVFKDKFVISKTTPDVGESREEVGIQYGGQELVVGLNPNYLIDGLKNVNQEEVDVELSGPDKAFVVRMENYLYLALPMRL